MKKARDSMAKCEKIKVEMSLKNIIDESREVAQALNELADNLERIEKKYTESEDRNETDSQ
jgi:phage host-nuclease inhibitor protein Gam